MKYAEEILHEKQTKCEPGNQVILGRVRGPTAQSRLNGYNEEQTLESSSISLPLNAQGVIGLSPQQAAYWAETSSAGLWLQSVHGHYHPIVVDRCSTLRPFATEFTLQVRKQYDQNCPLLAIFPPQ